MAITARKISSFATLDTLTGDEYIMVSYNGKSYKIPVSLLISNNIASITQKINKGDGTDNPATITLTDNTISNTFHVYNGKKGSKGDTGDQGPKGLTGDSGVALYGPDADVEKLIVNSVDGKDYDEDELAAMILSAAQGVILNDKLEALDEEYLDTQAEYDEMLADGDINEATKYFIFEE